LIESYKPKINLTSPVEKILLIVGDQVQEWLKKGIIKPSTSEFALPVVLVDNRLSKIK